ncbi:MAG: glycosyltransferase family 4 protein [Acidimicrobiia bacterium]|nr:glycosyltransferase family 4 protein [Acidimicrobiia bacterium]
MGTCAILSFRLGMTDGVSVVAELWRQALERLGWETTTVAGEGPVDHLVPGLAIDATRPPSPADLDRAIGACDLVIVENLLSIPMNLAASTVVIDALAGRPAILHHHDPPWQRARFAHITLLPPDHPAWAHVTINRLTERQFADRELTATTIYNGFDLDPPPGRRDRTRALLDVGAGDRLVVHPVRAIARKNIPSALRLCEALDAAYWIPGRAEEGYGDEFERLLAATSARVIRHPVDRTDVTMSDLYAASDLVAFPSTWEGFGNPPIEAAIHLRPAAVGHYPVADELRALGFHWLDPEDHPAVAAELAAPSEGALADNRRLVEQHLSTERMEADIARLLESRGWRP